MKKVRISILVLAIGIMMGISYSSDAQKITYGYRNSHQECMVKVSVTIEGVVNKFEVSGSKNNCIDSVNAGCTAYACYSANLKTLTESIKNVLTT